MAVSGRSRQAVPVFAPVLMVVMALSAQGLVAQEDGASEVAIVNGTDVSFSELYVSAAHRYTWGPNVLAGFASGLPPGAAVEVEVRPGSTYDIYAVDEAGGEYALWNVTARVDLPMEITDAHREDPAVHGAVDPDLGYLLVHNQTGYALHHVYSSPSYAASWSEGEHLLSDDRIIDPGERFLAWFDVARWGTMVFDLAAEDEDGDIYVLRRINLRNEYEITINLNHIRFY